MKNIFESLKIKMIKQISYFQPIELDLALKI
jgi:hypothetical protein